MADKLLTSVKYQVVWKGKYPEDLSAQVVFCDSSLFGKKKERKKGKYDNIANLFWKFTHKALYMMQCVSVLVF